jgi:glycosyltransferase involved in cell wall biosynthesis
VGWIAEFAKHCEQVTVISLGLGEYYLPANVKVLSLGKEKNKFKILNYKFKIIGRIYYILNFYRHIIRERGNYDAVFVHMNPLYAILGGCLWKKWQKKITLWYTHSSTNWQVRLAERIADVVFTASRESFRVPSEKVYIMGHGINTDIFRFKPKKKDPSEVKLLTVGRIAPSKNLDLMIKAVHELNQAEPRRFHLDIYGSPNTPEQAQYLKSLKELVVKYALSQSVYFKGGVVNESMPEIYQAADIFLNFSDTGSLDKAVLEAMSCGILVLTSNEAFKDMLSGLDPRLFCAKPDIARGIKNLACEINNEAMTEKLHQYVKKNHSLEKLAKNIIHYINK